MSGIAFTVHCPHCRTKGGQDMHTVRRADPDWAKRERRLVVECPRCRYVATVVVQLVDGTLPARRAS